MAGYDSVIGFPGMVRKNEAAFRAQEPIARARLFLFVFVVDISPMPTLTLHSMSVIGVFLSRMRVRNYSLKVRPSGQG